MVKRTVVGRGGPRVNGSYIKPSKKAQTNKLQIALAAVCWCKDKGRRWRRGREREFKTFRRV